MKGNSKVKVKAKKKNHKTKADKKNALLRQENLRLKALVDSFAQVNKSIDLKTVLINSLQTATKLTRAEVGSIALINEEGKRLHFMESTDANFDRLKQMSVSIGTGISGHVAQTGKSIWVDDVHQDSRFYKKIDKEMGRSTGSYVCSPLTIHNRVIGTTQLMKGRNSKPFSEADVKLLEGFASQAALAIENARAHKLELKQEGIEYEMQLCSEIQKNIFPKQIPDVAGFELYGSSLPAKEVGGDYYNYFQYDKNCMDIVIADVSGKGISAALLVTELHTCYRLLAAEGRSLEETVLKLNQFLCSTLLPGRFITLFAARVYTSKKEIEYVLAGHPPPLLIYRDGDSFRQFVRTGPVLGFDSDASPQKATLPFFSGDMLVAFSDGYSEAQNHKEELFGEDRILRLVSANKGKKLKDIHVVLQKEVDAFRKDVPFTDDVTILMLRRE